jgi:hypothetical protein
MTTPKPPSLVRTGAVAVAACAVCCAPLIAPPVLAAFATGGSGLVIADEVWCALGVAALFAGYIVYRRRKIAQKASATCACPPDGGCHTTDTCTLPDEARGNAPRSAR